VQAEAHATLCATRCKVMTLTPSARAISLCSFPRIAKSLAWASFVAISALECRLICVQLPSKWKVLVMSITTSVVSVCV
jgi:hypothetical protein